MWFFLKQVVNQIAETLHLIDAKNITSPYGLFSMSEPMRTGQSLLLLALFWGRVRAFGWIVPLISAEPSSAGTLRITYMPVSSICVRELLLCLRGEQVSTLVNVAVDSHSPKDASPWKKRSTHVAELVLIISRWLIGEIQLLYEFYFVWIFILVGGSSSWMQSWLGCYANCMTNVSNRNWHF